MSETAVVITLKKGRRASKVEGTRVVFSPFQCFALDDGPEEVACLRTLGAHLQALPGLALIGPQYFIDYLLRHAPNLRSSVAHVVITPDLRQRQLASPIVKLYALPSSVVSAFICEPAAFPRMELHRMLPSDIKVADLTLLAQIAADTAPARAWIATPRNIYPTDLPKVELKEGLDLVLLDCPSRNLALMPNGLAYVNNALKKTSVTYQILDLDIIAYHRFHIHRLYDMGGRIVLPSGRVLPEDPWQAEHYDVWSPKAAAASKNGSNNEVLDFFRPLIEEAANAIIAARPKILGLSIQQCNEAISREIVTAVKQSIPDTVILVGGFSCYNPDIGRRAFPECDYMCVGESDLTVGPLVDALARGERPANQAGILSRYDAPNYTFIPAPMVHNLDQIEFPKYEWCDLNIYRNYNDYQLVPIIASRGCRWSRCTFCAERFYWRIRSPQNFVDELEWLVAQGCHLFMFNESDLNGMPERVMEICDEIIRRGLHKKVKLTGQLRIHKKSNRAFFEKLREANFVALRFGVDAFSQNTLRLQKKGYTVEMISQNLKDCWEVGIYTEVNWVIGIPGETDEDVEEGIELILKNRNYIGRLANINPLILVNGGVYWIDPDAHNIVFKEPKEELYAKYPRALPADSWYSTEPYIDAQVRKERFERIVLALHNAGFPVGAWANRVIEDVKLARDPNRAASKKSRAASDGGPRQTPPDKATAPSEQAANELQITGKVISIRAAGEVAAIDKKAPAEPPLFGKTGMPPHLLRKLENHDIVFYDGWYYGIPHALGKIDFANSDISILAGVVKHTTEDGVVEIIEDASRWANTRGQYDAQEKQRAAGSYMRAGSALGETRLEKIPEKPKVLNFGGEYIAVTRDALRTAFDAPLFVQHGQPAMPQASAERWNQSPLRRLAGKLPLSLQHEIRRIIRGQSITQGSMGGSLATQSDKRLIGMLLRGLISTCITNPMLRFLRPAQRTDRSVRGTPVSGEDFTIVSIQTKDALPELMWAIGSYNLVKFDGAFYGLPHGVPVDWESDDIASLPGVLVGKTIREVVAIIESTQQTKEALAPSKTQGTKATGPAGNVTRTPVTLGTLEGYKIVSYEGWIYGIPSNIGHIDLTEVDVMDMPGVIRDVSRDVVENEILDRTKIKQRATA